MRLYLVQHAAAKSEEEDPARPLSGRGAGRISERWARYLKEHVDIRVEEIKHSGKLRAGRRPRRWPRSSPLPRGSPRWKA